MVTGMEFRILGPLTVRRGGAVVMLPTGGQRVVLAALLLRAGQPVAVDELAEALWGTTPPRRARVSVQNHVMRLRQSLGDEGRDRICTQGSGYVLQAQAGELDVAQFRERLADARAAARVGAWDAAAGQARTALSLWRGEPLADVRSDLLTTRDVPPLAELRLQALELRIDADLHQGRHAEVIAEAQALAAVHPLRERLHGLLMLALYRDGRQAEALAAYRAARTVLIEELGIEPGPGLSELHHQILNADPALRPPRVLAATGETKAGRPAPRHRLAARRRALGLTQEDLAARLRIERSTVVRWERGATQPLPWLQPKLARALQVPVGRMADLLGGTVPVGADDRGAAPVPRQLPAAVADFTSRTGELAALTRMLDQAGPGAPGTVVISAIAGPAGVGKTALALHWAHQVAEQFPGGQLHANLRGFDPAGTPATPAQVIRGFLDALGVPPERIPTQLDAQAGLYRSLVADKRMLIVLDNARDEQQVRPLLPASPASLVLVTSRHQLAGLAADGARLLTLDVLPHGEATQLLSARLGAARAAAEPDAVAEIVGLCAGLPLALAVAAARAAARPTFSLAALAAEIRDTGRLDALDAGHPAADVHAVFSWSYHQLSAGSARMFRLLSERPGPHYRSPAGLTPGSRRVPVATQGSRTILPRM
jgi:DNA-binding SARP family transcriptional activator/transcriptional regulator with XRE-family HTH domain